MVDVIICEDDPYFFLQYPEYDSGFAATPGSNASTPEEYLKSLAPSFLKYDFEGRVIRLDTFSKVGQLRGILICGVIGI